MAAPAGARSGAADIMAFFGGGPVEVALVAAAEPSSGGGAGSSGAGGSGCCSVWEVGTGILVASYRGGCCAPRGLTLLGGEYLLGAQLGKSCVGAWELQRKDQLQQKILCPEPVTCLTAAPNGLYILAGIAESIYLWEVGRSWEEAMGAQPVMRIGTVDLSINQPNGSAV
ncbi:WD repeat-containing protein 18 [Varanus komodoensis]|nr:WD repeat-containing protein 18 [Varanus komodoensis]